MTIKLDPADLTLHKQLLDKLEAYIAIKRSQMVDETAKANCKLPFNTMDGICSALISYWLYRVRIGEEAIFNYELEYILNWDPEKFAAGDADADFVIEHFINTTTFLQHDVSLRVGTQQEDLSTSFGLLLDDDYPKVANTEFASTFVFTRESLAKLLQDLALQNKMIRISDSFHTLGLINNNALHFYEPLSAPMTLNSTQDIATAIFYCLSDGDPNNASLALHITVTDLEQSVTPEYPQVLNYYDSLVQDNEFIFHLAARKNDFATMDFLFANGYEYKPCTKLPDSEIVEAIVSNRPKTLAYLLSKGLQPFHNTGANKLSPLGNALKENRFEMVCMLLEAGVNPNVELIKDFSAVSYAINKQDPDLGIIALLIGNGAELNSNDKEVLTAKFDALQIQKLLHDATEVNRELLHVPSIFILDEAKESQIISFLQHIAFKLQLQTPGNHIDLTYKNINYKGAQALQKIAAYQASLQSNELSSLNQKAKIHELLEAIHVRHFSFHKFKELSQVFSQILQAVITKPLAQHSLVDIQELSTIFASLDKFLKSHKSSFFHPAESATIKQAKVTRDKLTQYLSSNGVQDLDLYLQTLVPPAKTLRHGLYFAKRLEDIDPEGYCNSMRPILKYKT